MRGIRRWTGILLLALLLAACGGKATPSLPPTPPHSEPTRVPLPTPYPLVPAPPGLPPATSFLPRGAWMSLHVETEAGRWTVIAYGDHDEIVDETHNRRWVDRGAFLSRERHLWEALFRQAGFPEITKTAYLTECPTCPSYALAWRLGESNTRGIWVRARPYDARGPVFGLLPVLHALRLRVEDFTHAYPPGEVESAPPLPPSPTELDTRDILTRVYGSALHWVEGKPRIGEDITPWVLQAISAPVSAHDAREIVALVGAHSSREDIITSEDQKYVQAKLVLLQYQRMGTWLKVAESQPLALNVRPDTLGVVFTRLVDFDHDGDREILLVTASLAPRYLDGVYQLYGWKEGTLRLLWTTTSYYDNTTLPEQPDYATQFSRPEWADKNGDGAEDIVLHVTRWVYPREDPGFADTARVVKRNRSTVTFIWSGRGFLMEGE